MSQSPPARPTPETQKQRWLKYGLNVALTCVVVTLIAAAAVYLAQQRPIRIDTTAARLHSLQPQTLQILRDLQTDVRLVSLYPRAGEPGEADYYQAVSDLLDQYAAASPRITTDVIDPVAEPGKLDALIQEVRQRYGAEVRPYREFLDAVPAFVASFREIADRQAAALRDLPLAEAGADQDLAETIIIAQASVERMPERLATLEDRVRRRLDRKIPDYRGAVDDVRAELSDLDVLLTRLIDDFRALPQAVPAFLRDYAAASLPDYERALRLVRDKVAAAEALGQLQLDVLRDSIRRQSILVMGPTEMRVLSFSDVWQAPHDLRALTGPTPQQPRLRFAGEQQVSTAIRAVTGAPMPRVIFVRPGGPPLATAFMRPAQFSALARRLREAHFEVLERDLSGQFAMQARRTGMPTLEATDEQMRDRSAIWIVFSLVERMSHLGPNPIPGALAQHLAEGGSALVLVEPELDNLESALAPFGITARTDAVIVKAVQRDENAPPTADIIRQAEFIPYIFFTREYGQHPLARPIAPLESLLIAPVPVQAVSAPGRSVAPLLPITRAIQTWGETNTTDLLARDAAPPEFDPYSDIANFEDSPLHAGVAVEITAPTSAAPAAPAPASPAPATGGSPTAPDPTAANPATPAPAAADAAATPSPNSPPGRHQRIVVLGSVSSFSNNIAAIADPDLIRQGILTKRFPGNSELLLNGVFWLANMDTMLAISPAAQEIPRIADIPDGQLAAIRWGVLLIGLPALVLGLGVVVFLSRRE